MLGTNSTSSRLLHSKKALEDLQKINARRYYLQARNQENARNGGFFAKRDIEMNNREIRALNGVYSSLYKSQF